MATQTKSKKAAGIDMKEGARQVLARAKGPLHYREITKRMLADGKVKTKGATPAQSVSAKLATCAKKGDTFTRVSPGIYDLANRGEKTK